MNSDTTDTPFHLYSALHTSLSRADIADLYRSIGWEVHKLTWTDFEIRSPWAEFVIESESPILMHGPIFCESADIDALLAAPRGLGIQFEAELYASNDKTLVRKWTNPPE
ncbi:MAG TPA: hypothetical protein VHD36_06720 [Pirellulales bacterium]|nr:hypothetical protein [Pirellulales bacterium]